MENITPNQIKALHVLLSRLGLTDHKTSFILEYSEGRTESSKELTFAQAKRLIGDLNEMIAPTPEQKAADRMKRKIIGLSHEMNWKLPAGTIDMARINHWCTTKAPLKKPLDSHTVEELPMLVSQFEKLHHYYTRNK